MMKEERVSGAADGPWFALGSGRRLVVRAEHAFARRHRSRLRAARPRRADAGVGAAVLAAGAVRSADRGVAAVLAGAWAIALAGGGWARVDLLLWFALGAVAMRGAGCVYNDIVDRELDAKVARTRDRPLASGRVSLRAAWGWLVLLCLVGLVVLLQLNSVAALVALASLAPVAAYPFMKRITWWPQAWLGIVFSWAALVGMAGGDGRGRAGAVPALRGQHRLGDRL
jgi:hypothetical protein